MVSLLNQCSMRECQFFGQSPAVFTSAPTCSANAGHIAPQRNGEVRNIWHIQIVYPGLSTICLSIYSHSAHLMQWAVVSCSLMKSVALTAHGRP